MLSKNEWPPLHRAAAAGQVDVVNLFLRCGADPDLKSSEGDTPLYLAIKNEQRATAECLLAAGADPNARNSGRNTPLHLVATIPNPDLARLLLAHGANHTVRNDRWMYPILLAVKLNNIKVTRVLADAFPDSWTLTDINGKMAWEYATEDEIKLMYRRKATWEVKAPLLFWKKFHNLRLPDNMLPLLRINYVHD